MGYAQTLLVLAACLSVQAVGAAEAPAGAATQQARPVVYAWFPAEYGNFDAGALDWTAITCLSLRSVTIQPDGSLQEPVSRDAVLRMTKEAHSHGVKATILVWGTDARGSSEYLANHRRQAVQSIVSYVLGTGLDGVNLDDETWSETNSVTGGPNRPLVSAFFGELRTAFDNVRPGYNITWASPPVISASDRYGVAWPDYQAIAESVDAFAIMSYTMAPPTAGWSGGAQPIGNGGKVDGHARDYSTCLRDYMAATGGRKDKLLLGIATGRGGTEWTCRTGEPLSPIIGKPRRLSAEQARSNAQKHGRLFDPLQKEPWYRYQDGQNWVQGWYEDDESLSAKLDLARREGIQGVCLWVLDGVAEPSSTFEVIHKHLYQED
jgi:spore germination protein YaaH